MQRSLCVTEVPNFQAPPSSEPYILDRVHLLRVRVCINKVTAF